MAEDRDLLLRRVTQAQKPPTWALSQSPRGGNDSRDENKEGRGHRTKLRRPSHRHGNGEAPPSWGEDAVPPPSSASPSEWQLPGLREN